MARRPTLFWSCWSIFISPLYGSWYVVNIFLQIDPSQTFNVPQTYVGRIYDVPCPNSPGPYNGTAEVISRVHMLNRPFDSVSI
jgi:hypothetical protein